MKDPKRLVDGDDVAGALLGSARVDGPSARARQRTAAALGISAGVAGVTSGAGAASLKIGAWTKVAGGLVTLAIAGGGAVAIQHAASPSEPVAVASTQKVAPVVRLSRPHEDVGSPRPKPVVTAAPVQPTASLAPAPEAPSASAEPAPSPRASQVHAPVESSLSREVQSLDAAKSALDRGDAPAALAVLDQHARAFPNGALKTEAQVLRVEALFAAGDKERARTLARDMLARDPSLPQARRLRSVVGGEEK